LGQLDYFVEAMPYLFNLMRDVSALQNNRAVSLDPVPNRSVALSNVAYLSVVTEEAWKCRRSKRSKRHVQRWTVLVSIIPTFEIDWKLFKSRLRLTFLSFLFC